MNSRRNIQFLKFIIVGGINTAVTLLVIMLCKSVIGIDPYLSNALGYLAGISNSFLWNRGWVFNSHGKMPAEAVKFFIGCGICYLIQLCFVWGATTLSPLGAMLWQIGGFTLSGYGAATVIGMCIYTLCNFVYNRHVAFSSRA